MSHLDDLAAVSSAFTAQAALIHPETSVRSEIWPTAGRMVDHLGNIQSWVTEIVRTGKLVDRSGFRRPPEEDRVSWSAAASAALIEQLRETDDGQPCPALFGATATALFWRRRMAAEATKHLWDLRTATESEPSFPAEMSMSGRADIIDEFAEVFMPPARARGLDPLVGDIVLVASDSPRRWRIGAAWNFEPDPDPNEPAAVTLRAATGDLVLFVWDRAVPQRMPDRFGIAGEDALLEVFRDAPLHL